MAEDMTPEQQTTQDKRPLWSRTAQDKAERRSPPSDLTLRLSKARELLERGKQKQTLEELWFAEALARGTVDDLRETLDVTTSFEERVEPRHKSDLADLVRILYGDIDTAIRQATASPATAEVKAPSAKAPLALYVFWLIGVAVIGFASWLVYALIASYEGSASACGSGFLGSLPFHGGGQVSSGSLVTAAVLGGALGLAVGVSAGMLRRKLGLLVLGFIGRSLSSRMRQLCREFSVQPPRCRAC